MREVEKKLNYFIYLLLIFYLFVDTIAGILAGHGIPNIGQPYKMLIFVLMFIVCLINNENKLIYVFLAFSLMFSSLINTFFFDFSSLSGGFSMMLKIICVFTFYLYFANYTDIKKIDTIFKVNYIVFIINILLGVLGFGSGAYSYNGESVGSKGFFIAGNEVTYTYCCLVFYFINTKKFLNKKRKFLFFAFSLFISFFIGTKTAILSILLLLIINSYFSIKKRSLRIIYLFSMIFLCIIFFITVFHLFKDNLLIKMIIFKFNQQKKLSSSNSILNALLSGRSSRIPAFQQLFDENFSINNLFFGIGYPNNMKIIEMDFFELFYYFGFLFFFITLGFYWFLFSEAKKNKKLLLFDYLCVFISFFVGHVVYSVMGGIFFAMLNSKIFVEERKDKKNLKYFTPRKKARDIRLLFKFLGGKLNEI